MISNEINRVVQNSDKPYGNTVSGKILRDIQRKVLNNLREIITPSMGPSGSNTMIIKGDNDTNINVAYSKDGNTIIKNTKYQYPIEMAIKSEIENATRRIERKVGDGTSSIVVLSSFIFNNLCEVFDNHRKNSNPYEIMRAFNEVVTDLNKKIRSRGKECTLDDIYNITKISTNGNEELAEDLYDIYNEYGMNVFVDVSASTDDYSYIKSCNGVTIEAGYSDPCMINDAFKASCKIRSTTDYPLRIYHFQEAIDTPEMLSLFKEIIQNNIFVPLNSGRSVIPTVILTPNISRDVSGYMRRIVSYMNQFDESRYSDKPQLLLVTNYAGLDENYVDHISQLCGCKPIKKYIDNTIQKLDQEAGIAPTLKNVTEFYGTADEVEADVNTTKFVNPKLLYERDENGTVIEDADGKMTYSTTYNSIVNFLESQYDSLKRQGGNAGQLGSLKRQLNAIRSNMVEFFIGGISISDRDAKRDLVEDAVLNCRSAAKYGVGYGANTIGFTILDGIIKDMKPNEEDTEFDILKKEIYHILFDAYRTLISDLYNTKYPSDGGMIASKILDHDGVPLNMNTNKYDGLVLTSIESEPVILETVSKIITIMFTANQCILQAPALTMHY